MKSFRHATSGTMPSMDMDVASPAGVVGPVVADSIWQLACARAELTPGRVLIVDENDRVLTFGELRDQAESVAAGLYELGVRPGDVTAWQLPSRIDTVVLFMALVRLGVIQNPLIPMLREHEVEFICAQTRTKLLVVPSVFRGYDHLAMAAAIASRQPGMLVINADEGLPAGDTSVLPPAPAPSADESARTVRCLFYTSGTTSAPKGARHTDAGLLAASRTFDECVQLRAGDRVASLSPIAHVGGVLHVLSSFTAGSRNIITAVYDQAATTRQMEKAGVTLGGSGVPFIQGYLREQRKRPDHRYFPQVRAFLVGGSPRPPALHYEVKRELGGVGIVSGYGLTECPYVSWARVDDPDDKLPMTEGRPLPAGESGELRVRAPQLMLGYLDSSLDAEAFDDEGYFRTGDLAMVDDAGYLTLTGRLKHVIIRNMENISAREIENLARTFPRAAETAVIGLPDALTGERGCAVVGPADPADPPTLDGLVAHLRAEGLNPRKLPVQLEYVSELPRNAMNKVVKKTLKDQLVR